MAEGDKTYKVRYKNHCTPQERLVASGRYYLDSDCGRKLTGVADVSASLTAAGTLTTGASISTSTLEIVTAESNSDFVYIKNTGSVDVLISLNGTSGNYYILLSGGEAFASEIHVDSNVFVKTASGTSTIEHFSET
tara:strand:- start:14 stop:421 length:408 start_codon:yes stop_codon:yes gene_type:complete